MKCNIEFDLLEHETVRTDAISFLPDPSRGETGTLAVFAPGYTSEKSQLLSWGTGLAALGVPTLIFDLPGHYLGNLHPLGSFEDFKNHTPHLFARGLETLRERAGERGREAYQVVLGGHSLGSLMAAEAIRLPDFSSMARLLIGVGLSASPANGTHIFETDLYRETLEVRKQLVAPCLSPDRIIPWIKEDKANVSLSGETVFSVDREGRPGRGPFERGASRRHSAPEGQSGDDEGRAPVGSSPTGCRRDSHLQPPEEGLAVGAHPTRGGQREPMSYFDWQMERFREGGDQPAIIWRGQPCSFRDLAAGCEQWLDRFAGHGIVPGSSVAVVGEFSPPSISALLALLKLRCVLVPLSWEAAESSQELLAVAGVEHRLEIGVDGGWELSAGPGWRDHPLLQQQRASGDASLVLFSSGSTGQPKAILHGLTKLLHKFRTPRHCYRTLGFLLFDHIGGFNTLFYSLANLGCLVIAEDRTVVRVCEAIENHRVELLPTSPSFLNLLLAAEAHRSFDLSSLKLITYGTEVMSERTLQQANAAFPDARFLQTYGLSELGILRSKSQANGSLMVKVGGEAFETKVVDGRLHIRGGSSMLGYLNAPDPFDEDGWFDTGDEVEQDGAYYRFLGRQSDIINVGGQKVYPVGIEEVIAELPEVLDVAVFGEKHPLLGETVTAAVQLADPISALEMKRRIARHCSGRLLPYMIPVKVRVADEQLFTHRFKKIRQPTMEATSR